MHRKRKHTPTDLPVSERIRIHGFIYYILLFTLLYFTFGASPVVLIRRPGDAFLGSAWFCLAVSLLRAAACFFLFDSSFLRLGDGGFLHMEVLYALVVFICVVCRNQFLVVGVYASFLSFFLIFLSICISFILILLILCVGESGHHNDRD
jgi:hypothetical protein